MHRRWALIAVCLLPFAYVVLIFGRTLWHPELAILFRDAGSLTLPAKHLITESIRRFGELPGWNPFVLGGAPFLADPSLAVHYPLNLIFLLFSEQNFPFAHTWYLACHLPLAFAGYFLFFRRFSGQDFFSALAALSLAGGGYMVSSFYMSGAMGGVLATGWLFYFWHRYLGEGRVSQLLAASFFLGLPIYSGDPQCGFLLAVFFLPAMAFSRVGASSALGALVKLFALTALVVAPQILPTADLLLQSSRDSGWLQNTEVWSLHPLRLLEWIRPLPFGNSFYGESALSGYINGPDSMPFLFSIYGGFFFLPAFASIIRRRIFRGALSFWLIVAGFFLLAAAGSYSPIPLNRIAGKILPLWSSFRYPERLIVYAQLAVLLGTGIGLREMPPSVFLRRFAKWSLALLAIFLLCAILPFSGEGAARSLEFTGSVFLLLAAAILYFRKAPEKILLSLLVLCSALDLGMNLRRIVFTVPSKVASPEWSPLLQLVKGEWGAISMESSPRFFTQGEQQVHWPALERIAGGKLDLIGKLTLHQWLTLSLNTGSYFHLSSPLGFTTLMHQRQQIFWNAVSLADPGRAISLKGTNFIGSLAENGSFAIVKNRLALPLFSVPLIIDPVKTEAEALRKVADPSWDWRTRVVVQGAEAGDQAAKLEFRVEKRTFNQLTMKVRAAAATKGSWALWNESFDHFWGLNARGKDIPLFRANYWATAFRLPAMNIGEVAELEFYYDNPTVKIGRALFLVWLMLGGLLLYREKSKGASAAPLA